MVFIAFWAFIFITVGGFFGMIAFSLSEGLATWKKSAIALLVAALSSFLITGGFYVDRKSAETAWNNGYCTCGTEWRLVNVQKYRGHMIYYYTCDNCGRTIEI